MWRNTLVFDQFQMMMVELCVSLLEALDVILNPYTQHILSRMILISSMRLRMYMSYS